MSQEEAGDRAKQTTWQLLFFLQKSDKVAHRHTHFFWQANLSFSGETGAKELQYADCRPLEIVCKYHLRSEMSFNRTYADLLFLQFFFLFQVVSSKCLRNVTKRINWSSDLSAKLTGLFCFRASYPLSQRGLLSAPLTKLSEFQQPAATGQEANTFTCQQLSDWHTIPMGGRESPAANVNPSLHSADLSNQTQRHQRWRTVSLNAFCILISWNPYQWIHLENTFFHSYHNAVWPIYIFNIQTIAGKSSRHSSNALCWRPILLIMCSLITIEENNRVMGSRIRSLKMVEFSGCFFFFHKVQS